MYCFANNLPMPDERKPAEDAVVAGIGDHAGEVEHYSIVAAQNKSTIQVRIKLKDQAKSFDVELAHYSPAEIQKAVAGALAEL